MRNRLMRGATFLVLALTTCNPVPVPAQVQQSVDRHPATAAELVAQSIIWNHREQDNSKSLTLTLDVTVTANTAPTATTISVSAVSGGGATLNLTPTVGGLTVTGSQIMVFSLPGPMHSVTVNYAWTGGSVQAVNLTLLGTPFAKAGTGGGSGGGATIPAGPNYVLKATSAAGVAALSMFQDMTTSSAVYRGQYGTDCGTDNPSQDPTFQVCRRIDDASGSGYSHSYNSQSTFSRSPGSAGCADTAGSNWPWSHTAAPWPCAHASYDNRDAVVGANDQEHFVGFQSGIATGANFTGTLNRLIGILSGPTMLGSGTVNYGMGLYIPDINKVAGTLVNNYGIYIAAHSAGTNNWGIYSLGPRHYLAGPLTGPTTIAATDQISTSGALGFLNSYGQWATLNSLALQSWCATYNAGTEAYMSGCTNAVRTIFNGTGLTIQRSSGGGSPSWTPGDLFAAKLSASGAVTTSSTLGYTSPYSQTTALSNLRLDSWCAYFDGTTDTYLSGCTGAVRTLMNGSGQTVQKSSGGSNPSWTSGNYYAGAFVTNESPAIASAATIAPTKALFHLTGTTAVSTMTPITGMTTSINAAGFGGAVTFIADAATPFTAGTGYGQFNASFTATAGVPYTCYLTPSTGLWYCK